MCYDNKKKRLRDAGKAGRRARENAAKGAGAVEEKLQVLVVDDEADIRGLLRLLLERHGMAVIEAANGRQAITAIQVHSGLDLVILDVMMPKCDGVQACSEIRKLSSVPILFLTARTQEADMRDAYASGGDDYGQAFSRRSC